MNKLILLLLLLLCSISVLGQPMQKINLNVINNTITLSTQGSDKHDYPCSVNNDYILYFPIDEDAFDCQTDYGNGELRLCQQDRDRYKDTYNTCNLDKQTIKLELENYKSQSKPSEDNAKIQDKLTACQDTLLEQTKEHQTAIDNINSSNSIKSWIIASLGLVLIVIVVIGTLYYLSKKKEVNK